MIYLKRLLLMLQFLTTIPLPIQLDVNEEDYGKGLIFAPVVGLILGGILAGAYYLLSFFFPALVTSVITLIIYILLTGGIHLDGLGDSFDGLFSNRPKERILEIMRDSRVGSNAVLAVVCVLILEVALLSSMDQQVIIGVLILMPVAGRIGSLVGAGFSVYARSGEGLGKSFIECCGVKEVLIGTLIYAAIFYAIKGAFGVAFSILPFLTALFLVKILSRKIGGATGDILGAVCELNQCLFLIAIYLFRF